MEPCQFQAGLDRLSQPILPLIRLVQLLYLTGPFATINELLAELNEPIDTVVRYEDPAQAIAPYLDLLTELHHLKDHTPTNYAVFNHGVEPMSTMEAIDLWVAQQVVTRELEAINSLLCGPCGCSLCCTGPTPELRQLFFEIPLAAAETALFGLGRTDTPESRAVSADSEPAFQLHGRPFYEHGPALYHWRSGWSMILPRAAACPHLQQTKACAIYPERPVVCRRPQIFAYILDRTPAYDLDGPTAPIPAFRHEGKILAIWDCPYVKRFQQEIALYAERCELEPIFKENKA
jgi:Fe-S-cluster containining protein